MCNYMDIRKKVMLAIIARVSTDAKDKLLADEIAIITTKEAKKIVKLFVKEGYSPYLTYAGGTAIAYKDSDDDADCDGFVVEEHDTDTSQIMSFDNYA